MALLAAVAVVITCAAHSVGGARSTQALSLCRDNLRQIGNAYRLWAADHGDRLPLRVPQSAGGLASHPLDANAWFQFSILSNQLAAPRVLMCPADEAKRPAADFGGGVTGFVSSGYRNNSVSYGIGTDAYEFIPVHVLASDRNVQFDGMGNCSTTGGPVWYLHTRPSLPHSYWTNSIHGPIGNLLFVDGSVRTFGELKADPIVGSFDDAGDFHMVAP